MVPQFTPPVRNDSLTKLAWEDGRSWKSACRFLSSITPAQTKLLQQEPSSESSPQSTNVYDEFWRALHALEQAHARIEEKEYNNLLHTATTTSDGIVTTSNATQFLLRTAADEIWYRILDYCDAVTTVQVALTSRRACRLARTSAQVRTQMFRHHRQLGSYWECLRALEQIRGIHAQSTTTTTRRLHVPIPSLLLHRRVLVTGAGDEEYNGIYYCTGSNGNGFTKPRVPSRRTNTTGSDQASQLSDSTMEDDDDDDEDDNDEQQQQQRHQQNQQNNREENDAIDEDDDFLLLGSARGTDDSEKEEARLLRCIIAKRFSNETLLWYCSKEVMDTHGRVTQVFAYWAKLMWIGDASPDVCRYPSQSSILQRHEEGWQALSTTREIQPPIVELLDND
jgi:hypothetical protein